MASEAKYTFEDIFDSENDEFPYAEDEQEQDYLRLADLILSRLIHYGISQDVMGVVPGLYLHDEQLENSFISDGIKFEGINFEEIISEGNITCDIIVKGKNYIIRRETESAVLCATPLMLFSRKRHLSFGETLILVLALNARFNRKYERIFSLLQGDDNLSELTLGLAKAIISLIPGDNGADKLTLSYGDIYLKPDDDDQFYHAPLRQVLIPMLGVESLIHGIKDLPREYSEYAYIACVEPDAENILGSGLQEMFTHLVKEAGKSEENEWLEKNDNIVMHRKNDEESRLLIQLLGKPGDGRKFTLARSLDDCGKKMLVVKTAELLALFEKSGAGFRKILQEITSAAVFNNACIVLDEIDADNQYDSVIAYILKYMVGKTNPVFMTSSRRNHVYPELGIEIMIYDFPRTNVEARQKIWEHYFKNVSLSENVKISEMANIYQYNPGQMKAVAGMALARSKAEGLKYVSRDNIVDSVRDYNSRRMGDRAHLIESTFDWDDLVMDDFQKNQLVDACNQIKNRKIVQDDWQFGRKTPYGKGISILLYGAPGVGKTMSVQIISKLLGLDAYRIDLSQIVNKYIGETEKNLGEIFDAAKMSCSILFFDEADVLFSKRTDIKDSKDKYANMETAFLLQKMEEHDGIVILASNNINNFDEAFQRRMQYIINIPVPNESLRLELWHKVFPENAPLAENIDFEFLAKRFELAGSRIKSIAIHAAYYAADEGMPISMKHIFKALSLDLAKENKTLSSFNMSPYECYVPKVIKDSGII